MGFSLPPDVIARCHKATERHGINWSPLVEQALSLYLDVLIHAADEMANETGEELYIDLPPLTFDLSQGYPSITTMSAHRSFLRQFYAQHPEMDGADVSVTVKGFSKELPSE